MKLLLLLAFVASAYSAYFEPGGSNCHVWANSLYTFDKNSFRMPFVDQKTLLSKWEVNRNDPCKFSLVARTKNNEYGSPEIKWFALYIGVHPKNNCKFLVNFKIEADKIWLRGTNKKPAKEVSRGFGFLSEDGCTHISLTDGVVAQTGKLQIRSKSCPYALDIYHNATSIQSGRLYLGQKYAGGLDGICGNADGDEDNDLSTCYSGNKIAQNEQDMMLSCRAPGPVPGNCMKPALKTCERDCAPFSCATVCTYDWKNTFDKQRCAVGCQCDYCPKGIKCPPDVFCDGDSNSIWSEQVIFKRCPCQCECASANAACPPVPPGFGFCRQYVNSINQYCDCSCPLCVSSSMCDSKRYRPCVPGVKTFTVSYSLFACDCPCPEDDPRTNLISMIE